jgi:hypothetical protein
MDNFISGLEILVIGFTVTIVTLFVLAGILLVFTKVFGGDKKGQEKGGKAVSQKVEQQVKPATKTRVEISSTDRALRPEIVAAAIGALKYTFEKQAPKFPIIAEIQSKSSLNDTWAQAGRTRLINLRQDFVSYKRGKFR